MMTPLHISAVTIHIVAGSAGIIAGFVALAVTKGANVHRKSGIVFVCAMLTMSLMGAAMSVIWNKAPMTNGPVGLLTAYLVFTAFTTVHPLGAESRRQDFGVMLVALGVGLFLCTLGATVAASPSGMMNGMPSPPFFVFGSIALLAAAGDLRVMRGGGAQAMAKVPRLRRHLWRMTTAMLIATFSFFIGQAKVIPKPIRIFPLLVIPPLVVLVALFYWLWRVRAKRGARMVTGFRTSLDAAAPVSTR